MLKLYHYDRSTAAQRVRLGLEEKELEWESIIVDTAMGDADQRPDNFHEFNPKGPRFPQFLKNKKRCKKYEPRKTVLMRAPE